MLRSTKFDKQHQDLKQKDESECRKALSAWANLASQALAPYNAYQRPVLSSAPSGIKLR